MYIKILNIVGNESELDFEHLTAFYLWTHLHN